MRDQRTNLVPKALLHPVIAQNRLDSPLHQGRVRYSRVPGVQRQLKIAVRNACCLNDSFYGVSMMREACPSG